jgi:hypothetical protein
MLCWPNSMAVAWVRPRTAHLLVPYAMTPPPDCTMFVRYCSIRVSAHTHRPMTRCRTSTNNLSSFTLLDHLLCCLNSVKSLQGFTTGRRTGFTIAEHDASDIDLCRKSEQHGPTSRDLEHTAITLSHSSTLTSNRDLVTIIPALATITCLR